MRAREALIDTDVFGGREQTWTRSSRSARRAPSDTARFDEVLELLHLGGRSLPHAVLMMIPEAWERHESDGPRTPGVLPVPRVADGAVGRPGVGVLHRRHRHRRRAGPQRPAPVAHLGDRRRPRRHGLRGRRARPRPRHRRARRCGCSPAACSSSTPPQGRIVADEEIKAELAAEHPYQEWLDAGSVPHRRPAAGRLRADAAPPGRVASADVRLHLRGAQPAGRADGAHRCRGARLDGHRHPDRGAVRSGRGCSTTTSSSCSPR